MKYALNNGQRQEARPGLSGKCPNCDRPMVAKCGETNIWHWAHRGRRTCDPWWENETEWHRTWKGHFPIEWQEVPDFDGSGEKHIADVKTQTGYVLEFQHSYLDPEERRSRNAFYSKLVWIVDGNRRKTDKPQFQKILEESTTIIKEPLIKRVHFRDECRLLKEWHDSNALVFFDFQEAKEANHSILWFLFPKLRTTEAYISPFSRQRFIEMHNQNKFDEMVRNIILPIHKELANEIQMGQERIEFNQTNRASLFDLYLAKQRRRQVRF